MIQDVYIQAGGYKLELSEDDISLNFSIEDIKDVSKKKSEFSKTLRLPGTPKTNEFFKFMYDVNVENLFFNPAISTRNTTIHVGDNTIITGTMQLIDITNNNDEITYNVQVRGRLIEFLDKIENYNLNRLDLSEYNHNRNKEAIKDSWSNQIYKNAQLVQSENGDGYVYPYIIKELPAGNAGEEMYIYNQFPAFFVKTLWDKIMEFAGFSYTSNFINSEYFKRLIIPYVKDKIELPEQDFNNRTTVVGAGGNHPEYQDGPLNTGYSAIAGPISMDAQGWNSNENYNYVFWFLNEDGEVDDKKFQDPQNQWGTYNGWLCKNNGFYDFKMDIKLFVKYFQDEGVPFRSASSNNGSMEYQYGVRKIKADGTTTILYETNEALLITPTVTAEYQSNPWFDVTDETQGYMGRTIENIWMEDGDRIVVWFAYHMSSMNWQFESGSPGNATVKARFVAKESYDGAASYVEIKPSSNASYGNEDLDMTSLLPDMSMKNFIASIAQLFNLLIVTDKNQPNNLIIEPRDDYFASKTKVLNWGHEEVDGIEGENKLDRDSEIILTPMSEVDFKSLLYTYREDKDYFNETYKDEVNEIYGQLKIDVPNDFSNKEEKIEVRFSPSPMANNFIHPRIAPFFASSDLIGEFKPLSVQPRILFWGGVITAPNASVDENTTSLMDGEGDEDNAINTVGYPYAGHWNNPYSPSWDLNFGPTQKLYFPSQNYPLQNLYEKFHKNTIRSIVDRNAMMLEGYFYLTPEDIANFDFRDIIYLDGQYWRVNLIEDYNPVASDALTKVELYKLIDYDQNIGLQNAISVSSYECPNDVIVTRVGTGYIFQSVSGQFITEECCDALGGNYENSTCHVRVVGDPGGFESGIVQVGPGGVLDGNDVLTWRLLGGTEVTPIVEPIPLNQRINQNGINSPMNLVKGSQNNISTGVRSVGVFGSGNAVNAGVENALVVGDGVSATESNSIFLKNAVIDQFGNILATGLKVIDGGEDCVFPNTKTNNIDVIDGGKDAVRNIGGASKARPIIDGSIPIVDANDSDV